MLSNLLWMSTSMNCKTKLNLKDLIQQITLIPCTGGNMQVQCHHWKLTGSDL